MIVSAIKKGLKPEPRITVSQWADRKRYLDPSSSAEPGPWRTGRTPYLREIMDDLSEYSPVEEEILMKGAQLGATDAALNLIGYTVDVSPCPIMLVEPTKDVMELVSKTRVQKMFDNNTCFDDKIAAARSRDGGNTLTKKEFPDGILRMIGANSAAALRNMPVKRLILDEVDSYPNDLDGEGDPVALAKQRTVTFARRKVFILSTPTEKGFSKIDELFEQTDKRYYFLPCKHCGELQHLKWENLHYIYDRRTKAITDVKYKCEHCGDFFDETHKARVYAEDRGVWIATAPENATKKKVGRHLSSMYSPWLKWAEMALEYELAQGDESKLKTFYNTKLGLAYEASGEKPEWEALHERSEHSYQRNTIPSDDIAFLTVGADVQKDRIELEIVGWCEGKTSYSIDYRVLNGYTAGDNAEVWDKLAAVLNETWTRPNGTTLQIVRLCVDSGGHSTTEVYNFCSGYVSSRVTPIKGRGQQPTIITAPKAVNVNSKNKQIGGVKVWHVGVNLIKAELYGWLRLDDDKDGYCHFPGYDETHFKGLTAEELITLKDKKGNTVQEWRVKFKRNEPLDCRVYARAAAHMVGMDTFTPKTWAALRTKGTRSSAKQKQRNSESDYWND